jgi:23S rRNA (adenine2503-C2)-methyltransferase
MDPKPLLRDLVPDRFDAVVAAAGAAPYRARQVRDWAFRHGATSWDRMGNVPGELRTALAAQFDLAGLVPDTRQVSRDGTRKFLFRLRDGQTIESVIIPMADHATFCISSQVGCAMACTFCATARGGLVRNLSAGEIVEQVLRLRADLADDPLPGLGARGFNVVFMGMGEPLDNWDAVATSLATMMHEDGLAMSRRRIQVSTSGPAAGLRRLVADNPGVGLTLSLGGSTDDERRGVMPVPGRTSLREALDLAAEYGRQAGRRVTVAWVVIRDRTDGPEQAARLAKLLRGGAFKVNLIPWNPLADSRLAAADAAAVQAFQDVLVAAGVPTFVRASGGRDIDAACGQLRRRRQA